MSKKKQVDQGEHAVKRSLLFWILLIICISALVPAGFDWYYVIIGQASIDIPMVAYSIAAVLMFVLPLSLKNKRIDAWLWSWL